MRQQAKPFTVEIKKSRKSSNESKPLFGLLEEAAAAPAAPSAADRLFSSAADRNHASDIAAVFGVQAAPAERPATRVLPDLTVRAPEPAEPEEPVRQRKSRIAKTKGPRIPAPKPLPVTLVEPAPRAEPAPQPVASIRVRRRPKDETGLARSERWKRRLPQFAR